MKKVYKVRDIMTGEFWKGGDLHTFESCSMNLIKQKKFSPDGKTWAKLSFLKLALENVVDPALDYILTNDCEIIEYNLHPVSSQLVKNFH